MAVSRSAPTSKTCRTRNASCWLDTFCNDKPCSGAWHGNRICHRQLHDTVSQGSPGLFLEPGLPAKRPLQPLNISKPVLLHSRASLAPTLNQAPEPCYRKATRMTQYFTFQD